jgi:acyl transferase domain-containing protein/acyl carrier protein
MGKEVRGMMTGTEIAVVGISGRFPGASNVNEFWENLKAGRESIRPEKDEFADSHQGSQESKGHWVGVNSLLPDVDLFDASFFGFNPREAEMMDPQHRIFLECAWEAMEDAGLKIGDTRSHVSVFAGASLSAYIFSQFPEGAHLLETLPAVIANDKDYLATRTSYKLNFSGPSATVQCACSTSLVAVHLACQCLIAGECDAALAGGISISIPRVDRYLYMPGGMLSPDAHCRAFDARARGTAFAEGVGLVVLMRLEDALKEGHHIYAVILGSAVNNDAGLKAGYTAPSIEGQIEVIRQAQAVSGIEPTAISYVEAHGTGTVLGDAVELAALTRVFQAATNEVGYCGLGSVKTNIGHLSTAAGVAALIKTVLALKHRMIPASLNFEQPNPDLDLSSSPFYINTRLTPWNARNGEPRRAGVSSFGVGGTNAHVILEEAPVLRSSPDTRPWHLLVLSAKAESSLEKASENLCNYLKDNHEGYHFSDVVYTQQVGRRAFAHRRAVVCSAPDDAVRALDLLDPERVLTGRATRDQPSIAFMFPGQGAQYVGMGAELYKTERVFKEAVDSCSMRLDQALGLDLRTVLYPSTASADESATRLQNTALAQPALFLVEYALAKLLESWGIRPTMMIGHSIGEYVAAYLAGVISLEDALHLVAVRGRLMQEMQRGAMLSVSLPPEELHFLLRGGMDLAAINAPTQCVVSGEVGALARLERDLQDRGVPCQQLRTSHGFHSFMMEPMLESFSREVAGIKLGQPSLPYISNLTGAFVTAEQVKDPSYWARQIRQPVLFSKGIEGIVELGATLLVEIGPGRSLSSLARHCGVQVRGVSVVNTMSDARAHVSDAFCLMQALGRLWLAGAAVDWAGLHAHEKRQRVPLPTYPFERQRYWSESDSMPKRRMETQKKRNVADWCYTPSWKRLEPIRRVGIRGGLEGRCDLVFCDRSGVGREIAATLRSMGSDAITVASGRDFERVAADEYTIDPQGEADYGRLIDRLASDGKKPNRVVHLWSLTPTDGVACDAEIFRRGQEVGLFSLLHLLKACEPIRGADRLTFDIVSNGLFDILGNEPLSPQNATLLAFSKVVPQEHQNIVCRIVDVVLPKGGSPAVVDLADGLAHHIASEQEELVLALRNGYRWVQRFDGIVADGFGKLSSRMKDRGVYLITGGLGKIGLTLAHYLAQKCRARLVLTGRSALPEKEAWPAYLEGDGALDDPVGKTVRALCNIEKVGGEVWIKRANVASEEDMKAVFGFVEKNFGRLDGVVFGAGRTTLHRSAFQETSVQECEAHFEAKVHGLMVLERLLRDVEIDFCIVLSSLSTILGGLGHLAYSAANQFADALVYQRNRARSDLWTAVDWDAWQFEDFVSDRPSLIATLTRLAMRPEEGAEAFELLLRMPVASHVIISMSPLQSRLQDWIELRAVRSGAEAEKETANVYPRPELPTPYAELVGDLERRVGEIWQGALGLDRVGRDDDFFELGGHSLMAIQILSQVRQVFGVDFPMDIAFEATTVRKVAAVIDELLREKIGSLTEEEAKNLLKQANL